MTDPLLSVSDLSVTIPTGEGRIAAVDGVSFAVDREETLCLVGESGAGKTVLCETITGLLDARDAEVEGTIAFDGVDLTDLSERRLRSYRGSRIGHVFQNPQGALDPVYTVGRQVAEAVRNGTDRSKSAARERAIELLDLVELPDPAARADEYPHELSGGMKQRVALAIALAGDPDLLIADEPTTALDVTIEASVVRLLSDLQDEMGMSMLYVTHDLGIVSELADRIAVMYAGTVMETGGVFETFERPAHPYTQALLRCRPGWGEGTDSIGGSPPDPRDPPDGCRFHPRCPHAVEACTGGDQPPLYDVATGDNRASCVFHDGYRDPSVVRSAWELPQRGERSGDGANPGEGSDASSEGGRTEADPDAGNRGGGTDAATGDDGTDEVDARDGDGGADTRDEAGGDDGSDARDEAGGDDGSDTRDEAGGDDGSDTRDEADGDGGSDTRNEAGGDREVDAEDGGGGEWVDVPGDDTDDG